MHLSGLGCYQTEHNQHHSPTDHPPHRADVVPGHLAKAEQEPFPDHPRQLVLGDGDETEGLVEADQLQGRMHVQLFMPAGVDFVPARRAGQAPRPRNSSRVKTPSTSCPSGCNLTPAQPAGRFVPSAKVPNMRSSAGLASSGGSGTRPRNPQLLLAGVTSRSYGKNNSSDTINSAIFND